MKKKLIGGAFPVKGTNFEVELRFFRRGLTRHVPLTLTRSTAKDGRTDRRSIFKMRGLISICFSKINSDPRSLSRREAVRLQLGGLYVAFRPVGRTHAPLPEAHGTQTLQVRRLSARLLPIRPPLPPHEKTLKGHEWTSRSI